MRRCRKKRINPCLSIQTSLLDSFKSSSETHVSPHVFLDIGDDDPNDLPTVQEVVPSEIVICVSHLIYYVHFLIYPFLDQIIGSIRQILK